MKHWTEYNESFHTYISSKYRSKGVICDNIFCVDTEASSVFISPEGRMHGFEADKDEEYYKSCSKVGICYIWMMAIDGVVYYGREMDELNSFITKVQQDAKSKIIIFVHNLSYDWQYLVNSIEMTDVFCRETHKPLRASSHNNLVEWRDTYVLSNMSLDAMAKEYRLEHEKLTGKLDYDLVRTPETELTEDEMAYCEHDCLVLTDYIKYKLQKYEKPEKLPMTQTSEVRMLFRDVIKKNSKSTKYAMSNWYKYVAKSHPSYAVYKDLIAAYAGGYTHAQARYSGVLSNNIMCYDFKSSYPSVMLLEKFPVGKFEECVDDVNNLDIERYAYLIRVRLKKVRSILNNNYISLSKCVVEGGVIADNGRIYKADDITFCCTELDWEIIKQAYKIEDIEVLSLKRCRKLRLPQEVLELISYLFIQKEKIGKEYKKDKSNTVLAAAYKYSKELLNSVYGMCVTRTIIDTVIYNDGEWTVESLDDVSAKNMLSEQEKNTLLPYQWGVWVSAYARYNLWTAIIDLDEYVLYTDTDSIKCNKDVSEWVSEYNERVRLKTVSLCYDCDYISYDDIVGIGYFAPDGNYDEFITYGAKKYAYMESDELHITVSGLNSKKAVSYLNNDIKEFTLDKTFDTSHSGRLIRFYRDDQEDQNIIDYQGNSYFMKGQKHSTILQPTTYKLSCAVEYKNFVSNAKCVENTY